MLKVFKTLLGFDKRELDAVKATVKAQTSIIDEYKTKRYVTPEEWDMLCTQTQTIADQRKDLDTLAMWLRNNRKDDLAAGRTAGMTLAQAITMYLSEGDRAIKDFADYKAAIKMGTNIGGLQ